MKLLFIFVLTLLVCCVLVKTAIIKPERIDKTPWNLPEALSVAGRWRDFNGTWINDDEFFYTTRNREIRIFNVATNSDRIFVDKNVLTSYFGGVKFTFSNDHKKLLIQHQSEKIFRHSIIAKYDVYDIESKISYPVHNGLKLQHCIWSTMPDRLSYVYENNVYVHFGKNLEIRITKDGVPGVLYNGVADWVYEEEVLNSGNAMWWSPDGKKLVVATFNDTKVDTFKYFIYGEPGDLNSQYPQEYDLKYPKPGRKNPKVSLRVFDFSKPEFSIAKVTAPTNSVTKDHILNNIQWADNDTMLISWLNRRQNVVSLQLCSSIADCTEMIVFKEPSGWIDLGKITCYESRYCVFKYWIGNWMQIWNLDLYTGQNLWKSRGDFTVLDFYGYDKVNDKLYYRATTAEDPTLAHIYVNEKCLTCNTKDQDDAYCTSATAKFSKSYTHYAMICTAPNPSYSQIYNTQNNKLILNWELNTQFRYDLQFKLLPTVEYLNVTLADGSTGLAKMTLPPNLDKYKKYPVIVNVYAGPNTVRVTRPFGIGFDGFLATYYDVIVVSIDGRGSGNQGKKLLFAVNNNLGVPEVQDQIYVTKYLQDNYEFIDRNRTGVWGWSYGGYMTARIIEMDNENVFKCGISVAPVTSWLYYDTIYTERYMGLPTIDDNQLKYNTSSVYLNLKNFETHSYFLIHGTADDNVHYQQSLMLAKALQQNNILFEQMTYVDENHSIGNLNSHLYKTMIDFWVETLNLIEPQDIGNDDYDFV